MSRLEEIKNDYAKEFDYNDWTSFINDQPSWGIEGHMNDVCKRYAEECVKASLEKANEELSKALETNDYDYSIEELITDESNIVIL